MSERTLPAVEGEPSTADTGPVPAYWRIERDLRARIGAGSLPVGSRLPGRALLAREYGVALKTVERAVARLLEDGTLRADSRRGTFVARSVAPPAAGRPVGIAAVDAASRVSTASVGILMRHGPVLDFWKRTIVHSLERTVSDAGGMTHYRDVGGTDTEPERPCEDGARALLAGGVDAIAVIGIRDDISTAEIDAVLAAVGGRVPVGVVTFGPIAQPVPHVFYDQRAAGYQAAQHLLSRGASDTIFLAPYTADWVQERIAGARQAYGSAGRPPESFEVYPTDPHRRDYDGPTEVERACVAASALLDRRPCPSAVIGTSDGVARGFMRAAAERGLAAGRDYRIIGFDDEIEARGVGLTTMRPPLEGLGEEMARLLLRAVAGETTGYQVRLRSHLVPRLSTRPGAC